MELLQFKCRNITQHSPCPSETRDIAEPSKNQSKLINMGRNIQPHTPRLDDDGCGWSSSFLWSFLVMLGTERVALLFELLCSPFQIALIIGCILHLICSGDEPGRTV